MEVLPNPHYTIKGGGDAYVLYVRGQFGMTVFQLDTLRKMHGIMTYDMFHGLDEDQIREQMEMNFSPYEIDQTIRWMKAYNPEWL